MKSKTEKLLCEEAGEMCWSAADDTIYLIRWQEGCNVEKKVYALSPGTGEMKKTHHKGVDFSPSGKYYYTFEWDPGILTIYNTGTAEDEVLLLADWGQRPLAWLSGNLLSLTHFGFGYLEDAKYHYLLDCETKKVAEFNGHVPAALDTSGKLITIDAELRPAECELKELKWKDARGFFKPPADEQ